MEFVKKIRELPEKELEEVRKITLKYPDRIAVIVDRLRTRDPKITKQKYLVPKDLTASQFLYVVRKKIEIKPEEAIFMFCGEPSQNKIQLIATTATMNDLHQNYATHGRFLIIYYSTETTFGSI